MVDELPLSPGRSAQFPLLRTSPAVPLQEDQAVGNARLEGLERQNAELMEEVRRLRENAEAAGNESAARLAEVGSSPGSRALLPCSFLSSPSVAYRMTYDWPFPSLPSSLLLSSSPPVSLVSLLHL